MTRRKPTDAGARRSTDLSIGLPPEFAYAKTDSSLWGAAMDVALKENGGVVVLPVHWSAHEVSAGRFDFSSGSLGLRRLLDLARARGVRVCLRLGGSHAEPIDLPARLRGRRSIFAQDARGASVRVPGDATRFVPSLASTEGLRERMEFLDAVGAVVAEAVSAGLRVVVDCGGILRAHAAVGPFDADFHPASQALFWTFLEGRYGDIRELNDEYGASFATFSAVAPPSEFAPHAPGDLPSYFDWAAYQEFYRSWGVTKLKEAFCRALRGDGVAAGVEWACAVPGASVPVSTEELGRFFSWAFVEGADVQGVAPVASEVVFAIPREYMRLAWIAGAERREAEAGAAPVMQWSEFGFTDDVPAATREVRAAWISALAACGVAFTESEVSVAAVRKSNASVFVIPTFEFISIGTWRILQSVFREGRTLVVGPRVPWLSAALKPFSEFRGALSRRVQSSEAYDEYRVGRGRLVVVKVDITGESGRSALRRAVRLLMPKVEKSTERVSVP